MTKYSIEGKQNIPNYVSSKIIQESLAIYSGLSLLTHLKLVDHVLQTNINRSYDLYKSDILFNLDNITHKSKDDVDIDENEEVIKTLKFGNVISKYLNDFIQNDFKQTSNAFEKETRDIKASKNEVNKINNHNNLEKIRNEFKDILNTSNKKFVEKKQPKDVPAGYNNKMDHMIYMKKLEIKVSNSQQITSSVFKKENSAISSFNLMEKIVWSDPLKAVLVVF
jgi:hypothetical protein